MCSRRTTAPGRRPPGRTTTRPSGAAEQPLVPGEQRSWPGVSHPRRGTHPRTGLHQRRKRPRASRRRKGSTSNAWRGASTRSWRRASRSPRMTRTPPEGRQASFGSDNRHLSSRRRHLAISPQDRGNRRGSTGGRTSPPEIPPRPTRACSALDCGARRRLHPDDRPGHPLPGGWLTPALTPSFRSPPRVCSGVAPRDPSRRIGP
jgi:hypothetical protein